jgi:hypothetical protein
MPDDMLPRGTSQTSTTSARVSDIDYTGWLTKAEAATAIGVTTKTVERLAADGKIQQGATQRQGRGPTLAVYHPDDVARIAAERRTAPAPFVLPAGLTPPPNGNGHHADRGLALAAVPPPPGEDVLRLLFATALRAVSEKSETSAALFLTIPEAAVVSGFSQAYLRRRCQSGWEGAIKDGSTWKLRRKDLEAL